jgi:hypothetical protein
MLCQLKEKNGKEPISLFPKKAGGFPIPSATPLISLKEVFGEKASTPPLQLSPLIKPPKAPIISPEFFKYRFFY